MKGHSLRLSGVFFVACCLAPCLAAHGQQQPPPAVNAGAPAPSPAQPPAEVVAAVASPADAGSDSQTRIERARGFAVTGNFAAAALELEAVRGGAQADESARDVAGVLLMSVYLWQGNYSRANALLGDTFDRAQAGRQRDEQASRLYFALAGQTINGVRARLERYRDFGLNHAAVELPAEARADAGQMRALLERVVEQARQVAEDSTRADARALAGTDAVALLEDASAVRLSLARTDSDRARWQRALAEARQRLLALESRQQVGSTAANAAGARTTPTTTNAPVSAAATSSPPPTAQTSSGQGAVATNQPPSQPAPAAQPPGNVGNNAGGGNGAASSTASPTEPVPVGSLTERATNKVQPSYPSAARQIGAQGVVTVFLVVNERGQVESVGRTTGPTLLQNAAKEAARRWRFRPTEVDGRPVRVSGYVSFNFAL